MGADMEERGGGICVATHTAYFKMLGFLGSNVVYESILLFAR